MLKPIGVDQIFIRDAASWLQANTGESDMVAVSDIRMSFYAQRNGVKLGEVGSEKAKYFLKTSDKNCAGLPGTVVKQSSINSQNGKSIDVYRRSN